MPAFGIRNSEASKNKIHKYAKFTPLWKHQKKESHETKDPNLEFKSLKTIISY
jgi:hypothetical protein